MTSPRVVWVAFDPTSSDPESIFMDSSEIKMLRYAAEHGLKPAPWTFGTTLADAIAAVSK